MKLDADLSDLLFRALFCLIFVGLGAEHIIDDALIQKLMPDWVPLKRGVSVLCGVWLFGWGGLILIGWQLRWTALALGFFLVVVTLGVHLPGVLASPYLDADCAWMWDILQRTNLVKNVCLLGVCFHLLHHEVGRYSLAHYLRRRSVG